MFSIDENNKIKLTIGDTASFVCTVVDNDGNKRIPETDDDLTFSIDDIDFEKAADIENDDYWFNFSGSDTLSLTAGTYLYRVVLNTADNAQYTIIQDCFIDLLDGQVVGSEPEPTPEDPDNPVNPDPEPEPQPNEPEHEEHSYGSYISNNDGTHSRTCSVCGHIETESCNHYTSNGVCSLCGYIDPNYQPPSPGEHDEPEGF